MKERMDASPLDKIGRYRLEEELALFGLGTYWRGVDVLNAEQVLVQAIPFSRLGGSNSRSELFKNLTESSRRIAEISHPHLRSVLGVSRTAEILFIFHQWRSGASLATLLGTQPQYFSVAQTALLINQLASALEACHALGIVHGRLNPLTVGYDEQSAYLMDLGVARILWEASDRTLGTFSFPEFLAPEQVSGQYPEAVSDVYALGVLAYLLLTGSSPFQAESQSELLDAILYHEPKRPDQGEFLLHPNTARILLKALSKEPHNRFQSPTLFATALAKTLVEEGALPTASVQKTVLPEKKSSSRPWTPLIRILIRRRLGLNEDEELGRREQFLYLCFCLSLIFMGMSWAVHWIQPLSFVSEKIRFGQLEESKFLLAHIQNQWPSEPTLKVVSGELHFRLRDYEAAISDWEIAMRHAPVALKDAALESLLIRLFFMRPQNPTAQVLACQGLQWAAWPDILLDLGIGEPQRASRLLQLLWVCRQKKSFEEYAETLALRLANQPSLVLAQFIEEVMPDAESVNLQREMGLTFLKIDQLDKATQALRKSWQLDSSEQALAKMKGELLSALERSAGETSLTLFLSELALPLRQELESCLYGSNFLLRLSAWRILTAAQIPVDVPLEERLQWQVDECMQLGFSSGLEELVETLQVQKESLSPAILYSLSKYFLWRQDFENCQRFLLQLLELAPEKEQEIEVQGMLLVLISQSENTQHLIAFLSKPTAEQLLTLLAVSPDRQLRQKSNQFRTLSGFPALSLDSLLIDFRESASEGNALRYASQLSKSTETVARAAMLSVQSRTKDPWQRRRLFEKLPL